MKTLQQQETEAVLAMGEQLKIYEEQIDVLKKRIEKLESDNEALVMDVAFYGGNIVNLSCNNK
jgi:hypothetical protein